MKKSAWVIIILSILLVVFAVSYFLINQSSKTSTTDQRTYSNSDSPFGVLVPRPPEDVSGTDSSSPFTIDYSASIVDDYYRIIGVNTSIQEPGEGYMNTTPQADNPIKVSEVGYIKAWVTRWETPNKLRLVFQNTAEDIRGDYDVDCQGNTLYVSKKDASIVATGFDFISELEENVTVFIKCNNTDCTSLGGACILVK